MKGKQVAFKVIYNIVISALVSAVMCLAAPSLGGQPITWESFSFSYGIAFLTSFLLGVIFPVPRMGEAFSRALGAQNRLAVNLVGAVAITTFFLVIMNFVLVAANTGFATYYVDGAPVTFVARYVDHFLSLWCYIYLSTVLATPLAFMVAHKITGFPPDPPQSKE